MKYRWLMTPCFNWDKDRSNNWKCQILFDLHICVFPFLERLQGWSMLIIMMPLSSRPITSSHCNLCFLKVIIICKLQTCVVHLHKKPIDVMVHSVLLCLTLLALHQLFFPFYMFFSVWLQDTPHIVMRCPSDKVSNVFVR